MRWWRWVAAADDGGGGAHSSTRWQKGRLEAELPLQRVLPAPRQFCCALLQALQLDLSGITVAYYSLPALAVVVSTLASHTPARLLSVWT